MNHVDSDVIKKQRKRIYNQRYNNKKRQKIDHYKSPNQNYDNNSTTNDKSQIQAEKRLDNFPSSSEIIQYEESNMSLDKSDSSEESFQSNETINIDNDLENDSVNDEPIEDRPKKVLYKDSDTSLKELGITLLSLKFKHKMSEAALDDVLKIFNFVLPEENICPKSTKTLSQQIQCDKNITFYKICVQDECQKIQSESNKTNNCEVCNNKELIEFATYGIEDQLKSILSNPSYIAQLKKSNNHRKFKRNTDQFPINSALDGLIHLNLPNDDENEITISLNINTDGAPLIKSRNYSMWPVLASIVELNQSSRESFKNIILLGLWLHKKKPKLNGFFSKCYEELIELKDKKLLFGIFIYFLASDSCIKCI